MYHLKAFMKRSFDQSAIVALLMALLLTFLGGLSLLGIGNLVETAHWVEHTQIVIDRLLALLTDVEEEAMANAVLFAPVIPPSCNPTRKSAGMCPLNFRRCKS